MQEKLFLELITKDIARLKDIRTPQNVERARSYLTKAKVDLESAEILYKNKIFDNSIFLFQQSVEKATKGFYIFYTGASEKKLREEIGHESPLAFLKLFKDLTRYSNLIKFWDPSWSPDVISRFDEWIKRKAKFARMDKKMIMKFVIIPKQILEPKSEVSKKILSILGGPLGQTIRSMFGEEVIMELKNVSEEVYVRYSLLSLAYITFPHAISTRYPGGLTNPAEYEKGLGIVDAAPEMFKELKKLLSIIERELVAV